MTALTDFTTYWLWRCTLEGSLLIALVLGLRWAFGRNLGPRWRVALWTLVGVKLLLPAWLSFVPGIGTLAQPSTAQDIGVQLPTIFTESVAAMPSVAVGIAQATIEPPSSAAGAPTLSLADIAIVAWLLGVLVFIAAATIRQWKFTRQIRRRRCKNRELLNIVRKVARECGMRSGVRVYLDGAGTTPAVFGVIQPSLLLPEDWAERFDDASLRHVLMHELEHVRVGDVIWNWVATLLNALHWFNPLAWIANSNFQSDRELRCDAGTLSRLNPDDRLAYGHTLLNIQQNNHAAPAIAGLAPCVRNHPSLRQRLAMITQPNSRKTWLNCIFAAAAAGLICLSFGAAQADDERRGREGDVPREGSRDGDVPREGSRDGDRPREGARDGDRPREGARDGDRPREGARDGDRPAEASREGARDGDMRRGGETDKPGQVYLTVARDGVVLGVTKYKSMNEFREAFKKSGAKSVVIASEPQLPVATLSAVMNAINEMGISDVRLNSVAPLGSPRREGARDGDMRREGARDGDAPREGARDGDRPREGARDGDVPREGARGDGEMRREGARDGDAPREGARDGDRPREGARDGDQPREGSRDSGSRDASAREIQQLERIFKAYDKNSNDKVSFEEWLAMKSGEMTSDREKRERGWFDQADSNEDESLTVNEWKTWKLSQGR